MSALESSQVANLCCPDLGAYPQWFWPQIIKHIKTQAPAYPSIVHVHAAAFVGWLVLLTSQILLIRSARVDLHRKLGIAGVVLAMGSGVTPLNTTQAVIFCWWALGCMTG